MQDHSSGPRESRFYHLQRSAWESPVDPREKKGLRKLVDIQGSVEPSSSSSAVPSHQVGNEQQY